MQPRKNSGNQEDLQNKFKSSNERRSILIPPVRTNRSNNLKKEGSKLIECETMSYTTFEYVIDVPVLAALGYGWYSSLRFKFSGGFAKFVCLSGLGLLTCSFAAWLFAQTYPYTNLNIGHADLYSSRIGLLRMISLTGCALAALAALRSGRQWVLLSSSVLVALLWASLNVN